MNLEITGRKALITGADSGIGYATAYELLAEGATVVLIERNPEKLVAAKASLDAIQGQLHAFPADVTRSDSVQALQ